MRWLVMSKFKYTHSSGWEEKSVELCRNATWRTCAL